MLLEINNNNLDVACHICNHKQLQVHQFYPQLPRVASDCVPWPAGGKLATCPVCLCVQNPIDDHWRNECNAIYNKYKIYQQSAGSEQSVFSDGKKLIPRSAKIFQQALPYLNLKINGRLLDIGCANGELLRYFSTLAPHWKMSGFEIDDKRREEVEAIQGVEQFASGSLENLKYKFDLITLIHVLEHLPEPITWLKKLQQILTPNAKIIIQVPDPKKNPYNLLVADHCSHFLMRDLINISQQAGYEVIIHSDEWVTREYSLLLKKNILPPQTPSFATNDLLTTTSYPKNSIKWLTTLIELSNTIPDNKKRGIWGTAIAATWFYSVMQNKIDFFVDEDPNRIGQQHLGKPIFHPEAIPENAHVFIALTPEIANNIASRWSHLNITLYLPPPLNY